MDDWSYVVLAYAVVWGSIAGYAVILQQRVGRSRASMERARQMIQDSRRVERQEELVCDPVSAP